MNMPIRGCFFFRTTGLCKTCKIGNKFYNIFCLKLICFTRVILKLYFFLIKIITVADKKKKQAKTSVEDNPIN